MRTEELNRRWAGTVVAEAVRLGTVHAVVCPGSRSSPLAVACAETEGLKTWSVVDERSAAFFALGLAKQTARPSVLVCTSGTAGAHFLPAVVEASMGNVPLLILTADRPWELHGWGAPQTIEQGALFGRFVRQALDLGVPEPTLVHHLVATTARAMSAAVGAPRGPVHLNVPFREPLVASLGDRFVPPPGPSIHSSVRAPDGRVLDEVRSKALASERGVIVCGPRETPDGFAQRVLHLGRQLGFPVIADAASNVRSDAKGVVSHCDLLLRNAACADALRPQLVLRFGGGLTSKTLQGWLDNSGAEVSVFSDDGALFDPTHIARDFVLGDAVSACAALLPDGAPRQSEYLRAFLHAEQLAREVLRQEWMRSPEVTEPRAAVEVASVLPPEANLFLSSSMPIRDVDSFVSALPEGVRVFANRAANGIDGITSTALGVSAGSEGPTVLLAGDLALLHDLPGLLVAKRHRISLCIVAINNDGGGIFSFLPAASATSHFDELFSTPHGVDLSHVAAMCGARFVRPHSVQMLRRELATSLEGGLHLIEVRTERGQNVEEHLRLQQLVARELGERPWR